jgi:hypothetical protein
MPGKIFINYRRGDEPAFTQALLARLEQTFPPDQIFMDVDSIPAQCDVLLAVALTNERSSGT